MPYVGVDFGANDALSVFGPEGPVTLPRLPRVPGGASTSDKFIRVLPILLADYDVVVESATVGSSGVEPEDVASIVEESDHGLFTVSTRAVKNYRLDNRLQWRKGARYAKDGTTPPPQFIEIEEQVDVHAEDAEIIYMIASEYPEQLRRWKISDERLTRIHRSVRPHDKRNYRGDIPDRYMRRLPEFSSLPPNLQIMLGDARHVYSRARAMPFAMALDEPGSDTREGFEKVLGLYGHGYPSFYRRNTVVCMQNEGKRLAEVTRFAEVSRETRKEAWRNTRRNIRQLWHLMTA